MPDRTDERAQDTAPAERGPQRYELVVGPNRGDLKEHDDGDWVRWDDLLAATDKIRDEHDAWDKRQVAKVEQLRAEVQRLITEIYNLREDVARLREERDDIKAENVALRDNNASVKALLDERAQNIAALRAVVEMRRWTRHLCGGCGLRYSVCRYCDVGSPGNEKSSVNTQCGGHQTTECAPTCEAALAIQESRRESR